ncbi:hypothetical protein DNTS_029407 [Danionella cerebrum]|uniref:XPG-I domain-containing protein n=1 Tax=Danionella cerebrum TaxID=2873325 RepID=A0A553QUP7_9TELE|nr:hypothetical protein DNTS_029407 [Danionella translucida]
MGITKLAHLIHFDAPASMCNREIGDLSGKIIALDTSIVVNQFRSAVPSHLKLSPLTGLFYRTLAFLENDIKPVFVLDGRPPNQKMALLEKRAQVTGWNSSQSTNSTTGLKHDYCRLLWLMGVPCINAPGEAEALCAHLVKTGRVNAVASEDMDTLAFGGTFLLRQLNAKKDSEITEYSLPKLLESLQLTYKETHPIPPNWQYEDARKLFFETPKIDEPVFAWCEPDEDGLVQFLCKEKTLKEERIRGRMRKFRESRLKKRKQREENEKKGKTRQSRLEDFFPATRKRKSADVKEMIGGKQKK